MVLFGRIVVDLMVDLILVSEDGGSEGGDGVVDEIGVRIMILNYFYYGDWL